MKEMDTKISCIRLGNVHVISVTCPIIACEFLRKHYATFSFIPISITTPLISLGYLTTILVTYGEQWKKMRRIVGHDLLSTTIHQRLKGKKVKEADNLVSYIYNQCKTNVNDNVALINVRDCSTTL
ncbi:hypothetical protein VNO78_22373 [Psophocarpus tetragonolobus]|uniref:Cytochrome P450 n=1 Tax=Psophocarpus tetragonolobus TaxID=3891 RepID=A0AAN9SEB9_PSOTE